MAVQAAPTRVPIDYDTYAADDGRGYGWVMFVGYGVFLKNQLSRWTSVVLLAANCIAQLLMIPAYPFWACRSSYSTSSRFTV